MDLAKLISDMTARNIPKPPKMYGDSFMNGIPVLVKSKCIPSLASDTKPKPIAIQIKKIPIQIPISCILIMRSGLTHFISKLWHNYQTWTAPPVKFQWKKIILILILKIKFLWLHFGDVKNVDIENKVNMIFLKEPILDKEKNKMKDPKTLQNLTPP